MEQSQSRLEEQAEMLVNRARKNLRRLRPYLAREGVTCYRLYDRDIPELPLAIDWYEGRLHAALFSRGDRPDDVLKMEAVLAALASDLGVAPRDVFLKARRVGKGGEVYGRLGSRGPRVTVGEGGLRFLVNLTDRIDTGLFLDHRITRLLVRDEARGKRFLNLFAYTGAFSVYAAAGGATSTTTVDLSRTYLDWARDNMAMNGFDDERHRYVRDDVRGALDERRVQGEYDLAVIDPPTISKSKGMARELDVQKDHALLITRVLERMGPGGVVYFSTNFQGFKMDEGALAGASAEEITHHTVPPDFRARRPHRAWRLVK